MLTKFETVGRIRSNGEKNPKSQTANNVLDSESEGSKASSRLPLAARRKSPCLRILLSFIVIKTDAALDNDGTLEISSRESWFKIPSSKRTGLCTLIRMLAESGITTAALTLPIDEKAIQLMTIITRRMNRIAINLKNLFGFFFVFLFSLSSSL